ncbi:MAG: prepilin-type N-terminal cleavage/methylation domain-containing protein [Candidatus Omnitrophota bacterium]|nr:MAG: prepilin-type N-terminal cleavage/methylation domain-containing protein [Candidatus Omnitrophota bacterium]
MPEKIGKYSKGFTLIELMVVVLIISLLAAFGLPQYNKAVEKSRAAEAINILYALRGAQLRYAAEFDDTTDDPAQLDIGYTTLKHFKEPPTLIAGVDPEVNADRVVASLERREDTAYGGEYMVHIRANGNITCSNGGASGTCTALGFRINY